MLSDRERDEWETMLRKCDWLCCAKPNQSNGNEAAAVHYAACCNTLPGNSAACCAAYLCI